MELVAEKQWAWHLFRDDNRFFLKTNCSAGSLGYSWTIELSQAEVEQYAQQGEKFISQLAEVIYNSVPVARETKSSYKARSVPKEIEQKMIECMKNLP